MLLNSISDSLLVSIYFSCFTGESSIPSNCSFFLCLSFLGDSFCLFLQFQVLCSATCLHGWTSVIRFVWDSVVHFLLSHCLDALGLPFLSLVVVLLLYLDFYLLVATFLVGSLLQWVYWYSQLPPCLVCCCRGVGQQSIITRQSNLCKEKELRYHISSSYCNWTKINKGEERWQVL